MPSPEFEALVTKLREARSRGPRSIPEMREQEPVLVDAIPAPHGVSYETADADGVPVEWALPQDITTTGVLLYFHGGGYCTGSIATHRKLVGRLAVAAGMRALSVEYRLAPEHPHPAAVDDGLRAFRWLRQKLGDGTSIVIAGDSAGGGIALSVTAALRDIGEHGPSALIAFSPSTDLAKEGDSIRSRAHLDPLVSLESTTQLAEAYLAGADPKAPTASPLYAEFGGFPPMLLFVGTSEILHDDTIRVAEKARAAEVSVEVVVGDDMIHIWPFFTGLVPDGQPAIDRAGDYANGAGQN